MAKRRKKSQIPDFDRVLRQVADVALETVEEHVSGYAKDQVEDFRTSIEEQTFESFQEVPLSDAWLETKRRAGADLRVMIATGNYTSKIRVHRQKEGKKTTLRIGFGPKDPVKDLKGHEVEVRLPGSNIQGLEALSMVHELGSIKAKVPARPHWGPHRHKMELGSDRQRLRAKVKVKKALRARLRGKVVVR